jgi:predicted transcriptional regulator
MSDLKQLETIEQSFAGYLSKMGTDHRIERFKKDYQKLLMALRESHNKERKAIQEYKEYSENINENAGKIKVIMSISEKDSKDTENLRNRLMEAKTIYAQQTKNEENSLKKITALEITMKK